MPENKGWRRWERDVAELFGLDQTISSGNKFFDQGDAVTRGHVPFAIYADAKYTEAASKVIKLLDLQEGQEQAAEQGKRFIMPLRFHIVARGTDDDWVLISAHDLAELIRMVND